MFGYLIFAAVVLVGLYLVRRFALGGDPDAEAAFLDREPGALVVDVRTPAEFAGGHLAGARNVDVSGDFRAQMETVDRERPVYLYCRTGNRSARAARTLGEMGFHRVVNAGGFRALAAAGAPVGE